MFNSLCCAKDDGKEKEITGPDNDLPSGVVFFFFFYIAFW